MIVPGRAIAPEEVADHYDDLDPYYREVWGEHVHHGLWREGVRTPGEAVRELVRHLADRLEIGGGCRVIDIGSGYGATARQLARERGARVTAITLSPAQHAFATASPTDAGGPDYRLGDWLTNDFPQESFECAVAIESTEHMHDKAAAFHQIGRVLAPGGRAGICAWIAASDPTPWMVRHLLEPICREGRIPGMGTEHDYRMLLTEAGLEVESVEDLSAGVAPTWRHAAAGAWRRILFEPRYRSYMLDSSSRNREFALTLLRILAAYRTGAMRYLLFVARKPLREA